MFNNYNPNSFSNFLKNPFPTIGNAFKDLFKPQAQPAPSTSAPYYQIKPNDTSLTDVSNATGVPLPDLVSLNGNRKTLGPTGSYMTVKPPPVQQYQSPTTTPTTYPQQSGQYGPSPTPFTPIQPGVSADRFDYAHFTAVDNQLQAGHDPNIISGPVAAQMIASGRFTQQDLINNGYVQQNGNWFLKNQLPAGQQPTTQGGGGGGNSDFANTGFMQRYAANGTSFYNQLRWDDATHKYQKIGDLIRRGRLNVHSQDGRWHGHGGYGRRRGGGGGASRLQGPGSAEGKSTVLELHLGSG